jgi:hypothetical protein
VVAGGEAGGKGLLEPGDDCSPARHGAATRDIS